MAKAEWVRPDGRTLRVTLADEGDEPYVPGNQQFPSEVEFVVLSPDHRTLVFQLRRDYTGEDPRLRLASEVLIVLQGNGDGCISEMPPLIPVAHSLTVGTTRPRQAPRGPADGRWI